MTINEIMKEAMKNHKQKIELFQWATISSVASLIFSEYISNIKQKSMPKRMVMVPPIKYVKEILDKDSQFINMMSERLIDELVKNELFIRYKDAPEFVIFNDKEIEVTKTIFDLYILPNVSRRIPETIAIKFGLNDENNQLMYEDSTIDLFNREPINDLQFDYIVEEVLLNLLILLPSIEKEIIQVENNKEFEMDKSDILTIGHETAICPINFDKCIIMNDSVNDLLSFVTSTNFFKKNNYNGEEVDKYTITTGVLNQVSITKLK